MISRASAKIGSDGAGKDGVEGLLERVGRTKPEVLAGYLVHPTVPKASGPEESAALCSPIEIRIFSLGNRPEGSRRGTAIL